MYNIPSCILVRVCYNIDNETTKANTTTPNRKGETP
uniref:Uncharacterized protein n=1 Tax=Ackermannviridae sp. TaxID=2831612 RepID=A0A8S5RTN3_9CAUD|nr:MAG TPA: hypothetical protein [Ackermannviridae sp.]